jgi:S-adenosylmethionine synthetase, central domain
MLQGGWEESSVQRKMGVYTLAASVMLVLGIPTSDGSTVHTHPAHDASRADRAGGPEAVTDVLVSTQHCTDVSQEEIRAYVAERLLPRSLGRWYQPEIRLLVNPTGSFGRGGPAADCGLTGR